MPAAGGSLDKVEVLKVLGMVNAVPGFGDQPKVINGCSDLFVAVLGERGRHARSAVGMGSLPVNIPVEIEAVMRVVGVTRSAALPSPLWGGVAGGGREIGANSLDPYPDRLRSVDPPHKGERLWHSGLALRAPRNDISTK